MATRPKSKAAISSWAVSFAPRQTVPALAFWCKHDLFRKPIPTFRDHALSADIEGRDGSHVDKLRIIGGKRHDLNRAIKPDQHWTDHGGAAKLHQHLGR